MNGLCYIPQQFHALTIFGPARPHRKMRRVRFYSLPTLLANGALPPNPVMDSCVPRQSERKLISADQVRDLLAYDSESGLFRWRRRPHPNATVRPGDVAGCIGVRGYVEIRINRVKYMAHRLVWLWTFGVWPQGLIDHRDRNKGNNRISNLRPATFAQNAQNAVYRIGATGLRGVTKDRRKFMAQVVVNGNHLTACGFDSAEKAHQAYKAMRLKAHGEFVPIVER